jgi:hypothetical protein
VTIDQARALAFILRNATIYRDILTREAFVDQIIRRGEVLFVSQWLEHPGFRPGAVFPVEESRIAIVFKPLLPQGEWTEWHG